MGIELADLDLNADAVIKVVGVGGGAQRFGTVAKRARTRYRRFFDDGNGVA